MRSKIGATVALLFGSIPVHATAGDITYLRCDVSGVIWNMALNESAGRVSYEHANGIVIEPAVFTADRVVWKSAIGSFVINRTDLTLTLTMSGRPFPNKCTIEKPLKRAF
jgi:hypothetical protein